MMKISAVTLVCVGVAGVLGGCATRPVQAVGSAGSAAGGAAVHSAQAGWNTLDQTYKGFGGAVAAPLKDFNVYREQTPVVLAKAKANPYDVKGLDSCEAVLTEVSALDLVLGPDMDTPDAQRHRDMYLRGADAAATAALDAMKDAASHFIPMRSTIRRLSGANRADEKAKRAILAGQLRRAFLKSYGMQHNCAWPAAPIGFEPAPGGPVWPALIQVDAPNAAPVLAGTTAVAQAAPMSSTGSASTLTVASAASPKAASAAALQTISTPALSAAAASKGSTAADPLASEPQAGAWRIGRPIASTASSGPTR